MEKNRENALIDFLNLGNFSRIGYAMYTKIPTIFFIFCENLVRTAHPCMIWD